MDFPGDTKPCECGKIAVMYYTGMQLTSNPPQSCTEWRCYGCGRRSSGDPVRFIEKMRDQDRKIWEEANK